MIGSQGNLVIRSHSLISMSGIPLVCPRTMRFVFVSTACSGNTVGTGLVVKEKIDTLATVTG